MLGVRPEWLRVGSGEQEKTHSDDLRLELRVVDVLAMGGLQGVIG